MRYNGLFLIVVLLLLTGCKSELTPISKKSINNTASAATPISEKPIYDTADKATSINGGPIYYAADELESLFLNSQGNFQEIAQIISDNKLDGRSGKFRFVYDVDYPKQFFSAEEWEKISCFFNKIRPYEIMRYQNSVIGFHFAQSNNEESNSLYYFAVDNRIEFGYHKDKYDKFTEITEKWYLGERKHQ